MSEFRHPHDTLAGIDAIALAGLITAATDVALILDRTGVIRDVAIGNSELGLTDTSKWVGRPFAETVSLDSRSKAGLLLKDAASGTARKWRHINYPSSDGSDVPVMYAAVKAGDEGRVVAFGRDLRTIAALQQRLVDSQQAIERDYLRLRHLETRYRLLFQTTAEATLVVDAATEKVMEANAAAAQLAGRSVKEVVDDTLSACFEPRSQTLVQTMLSGVRSSGLGDKVKARLAGASWEVWVTAELLRQDGNSAYLVRLLPLHADAAATLPEADLMLRSVVESAPDGFVMTNMDGQILTANSAFIEMTQRAALPQLQGASLDRWLGRSQVDLNVLIANLRQHGAVRLFATTLRGEYGSETPVEVSATAVRHIGQPCLGFTVRDVGRRLEAQGRQPRELPRSAGELTKLVGRVPMKDIVSETSDLIEQLCIEAALELTRDNRASAAEMLGLSRQSLYVKLRRYNLGDLRTDSDR